MKSPLHSALRLSCFAAAVLCAVTLVHLAAQERIQVRRTEALLAQFRALAPQLNLDHNLLMHKQSLQINGQNADLYLGQDGTRFFRITTNKGYNGDIALLVGIAPDRKTLLGVRVLNHKETPGLGDKIEARISPWILNFQGKSLENTRFAVKKDGGDFDSFTGATITPRAVVNQVGALLKANALLDDTPAD